MQWLWCYRCIQKLIDTLEVGLGYAQTDANNAGDNSISTGDNNTYTVAARYTSNGVFFTATYEGGKVARSSTDESDFDAAADAYLGYTFDDNNVNMTYNYFNADKTSFQ